MTGHPKGVKPARLTGLALAQANELIDSREGQSCARCGAVIWSDASRHHRKRRAVGNDLPSNRVLLCGSGTTGCHGWAHAHPALARRTGFIVSAYADPREVPIQHARYGWVRLTDEGFVIPCDEPEPEAEDVEAAA